MRRSPVTRPFLPAAALVAALALVAAGCTDDEAGAGDDAGGAAAQQADGLLSAVSTRADMVTGGDVLVEVAAGGVDSVTVDGEAVEVDFTRDGDVARGLVTGLPEGTSTVAVEAGGDRGELEVTNHPVSGPVFSGEQLPIVVCTTDRYGLGGSEPPLCDAEPTVRFAWVDAEGDLQFVDDPAEVPPEAATVELDGEERPAVLRWETGVINRGVYSVATLANGSSPEAGTGDDWDRDHWNGRLVYRFGGGCGTTYGQGFNFFGAPDLDLLAKGYAFATNTFNTFQVQCQDIVSAESAMMTKEHFVEQYGVPEVTIGEGGSGGAIQQLLVAQNYPGILDAIAPSLPFPDGMSIAPGVLDCALLGNYYATEAGAALTPEQRRAVNGHLSGLTCSVWQETFVPVADPSACGFGETASSFVTALPGLAEGLPTVPEDQAYDARSNPDGLRCTLQDSYPQIFDEDPETGFAERPVDNVGVQYGLDALNAGTLSVEQFLDLNEGIGGLDIDGQPVAERMVAEEDTLERIYETGRVVAPGPLLDIPILLTNVYTDDEGDIHDRFRMFSIQDRLAGEDGAQAPGLVMWTRPKAPEGSLTDQLAGALGAGASATEVLDEWATALAADDSDADTAEKLAATRPEAAVNACFDLDGQVVDSGEDVYDRAGPCRDDYPVGDDPRTAAGAPRANDILKCSLQSVEDAVAAGVYEVALTEQQVARLEAIHPDGVCDWTAPGIGQVPLGRPWQAFD